MWVVRFISQIRVYLDDKSLHTWITRHMVHKIDENTLCFRRWIPFYLHIIVSNYGSLQYSSQNVETDTVSLEFSGKILTFTARTFVLTEMCSSPPPMLSHAYVGALRWLQYTNQHWGRGNEHKCFKICDEYCSSENWNLKVSVFRWVAGWFWKCDTRISVSNVNFFC